MNELVEQLGYADYVIWEYVISLRIHRGFNGNLWFYSSAYGRIQHDKFR